MKAEGLYIKKEVKDKDELINNFKNKKDQKPLKMLQVKKKLEQKIQEFEFHQADILSKLKQSEQKVLKLKQ